MFAMTKRVIGPEQQWFREVTIVLLIGASVLLAQRYDRPLREKLTRLFRRDVPTGPR